MKSSYKRGNQRNFIIKISISGILFLLLSFSGCKNNNAPGIDKVGHVVIIYMENHSFDNLYGQFPGADGLSQAPVSTIRQLDSNNVFYKTLPQTPMVCAIPDNLPNYFFNINQYIRATWETPDVVHEFYQEQLQINGGKMNKFIPYNDISYGLCMGYYQTDMLPLDTFAKRYTLCDHFFHSAFGGSFLNHIWLISARTPVFLNAPKSKRALFDSKGNLLYDGAFTPDGYVVNTSFSVNEPHPKDVIKQMLVPSQTYPTIGDRLSDKGISWAWYSGGWDNAMAGYPDTTFQYHHQPFVYFAKYADGTKAKKEHLKDEMDFYTAARNGTLPSVSFVKPLGLENEHPGYSNVMNAESHAVTLINAVLNGPDGKDAVIIVTYDENGGFWDHVPPPKIDRWGPGTRVPAIIISPFAKKGFVDHTQYETVSILAFIEKRWGLKPLTTRDAKANPLSNAFDFSME